MTDDERLESLRRDGAVHVPSLLDEQWCDRLRRTIARSRTTPSVHYGVLSPSHLPLVDSDLFGWRNDPQLRALTHESPVVELAASLLECDQVVLIEDQWFSSAPGASTPSPWHQDEPYYHLDRPFLTIWVSLDDVDADASLRFVPGSHLGGVTYEMVDFTAPGASANDSDRRVPDIWARPATYGVRSWQLRAGDAVALDSRTLHASGDATVARPFRRISTRWAEPATRFERRSDGGAAFWELLGHGLRDGDLIAGDVFPTIAPRERNR